MLLTCLKRENIASLAVTVAGLSDDASGNLPHVSVSGREKPESRATEVGIIPERLAVADYDVRAVVARTREPDLRVANKRDLARRNDADLEVSAADGTGIGLLVTRVRETLVPPEDLAHPGAWVFDERLQP